MKRLVLLVTLMIPAQLAAEVTTTVSVAPVSDYVFRGLTQTRGKATFQGSLEVATGGWRATVWASGISSESYPGATTEIDVVLERRFTLTPNLAFEVGATGYLYPGAGRFDTVEVGGTLSGSRGWRAGVAVAVTDLFGADSTSGYTSDTTGSRYWFAGWGRPLGDHLTFDLHLGAADVDATLVAPGPGGGSNPDTLDAALTLTWLISPVWSASVVTTWTDNAELWDDQPTASGYGASEYGPAIDLGGWRAAVQLSATAAKTSGVSR